MRKTFLSLLLACTLAATGFAGQPKETPAATLTNWLDFHCKLVRRATGLPHVAYSRHFSYTAVAMYESVVNSDPAFQSLAGQLNGLPQLPSPPKTKLHWPASLNAAYASMLRHFYAAFTSCRTAVDSMEATQKQGFFKTHIPATEVENGARYGAAVAGAVLQWAATDGANNTKAYTPLKGEGLWTPATAAAVPFWSENRSLTTGLATVYSIRQPLYSTDSTADFFKMAHEVYVASLTLTPEQKATALYWDDSPNGRYVTVFGHWTSILSSLIKAHRLSTVRGAEAYAKMAVSLHEACLLAWKGKYQYNVLRPVSYIQQRIDKEWQPLIATPPHPEFPAAHATLSNAAAVALCSLFGENCRVTDNAYADIGLKERTYASLQDVATEAGLSRLYGGIHYRYSIEQGFLLGTAAARHVDKVLRFHPAH